MKKSSLLFLVAAMSVISLVHAEVKLPRVLSDHAILKSSAATNLWGWADAGEVVDISLAGLSTRTTADPAGKWKVALNLQKTGPGPFELIVKGKNTIKVADVLVGEVWYASGQSNMEFGLGSVAEAKVELARPANPRIRFFKVDRVSVPEPQKDVSGSWVVVGPSTATNLSAVACYFARDLEANLKSPVGIIQSTWGGSSIEAWISPEALRTVPDFVPSCERDWALAKNAAPLQEQFKRDFQTWVNTHHREDVATPDPKLYTNAGVDEKTWVPVNLANPIAASGLSANGVLWLRRTVNIPEILVGKPILLRSGPITGLIRIYWNGEVIYEVTPATFTGRPETLWLNLPNQWVHAGDNQLAIRIYSPTGPAAFAGDKLTVTGEAIDQDWLAKSELAMDDPATLPAAPVPPPKTPNPREIPGYLFNGMVQPFQNCTLSGVIWYQGETNAGRAWQYRTAFPLMIQNWRSVLGQADLPFYFCQIPRIEKKTSLPQESIWAELREAQSLALQLPHTGQAVIIDTGEANDIHPLEKALAGERLARLALGQHYQIKDVVVSGPIYLKQAVEGTAVRLYFKEIANGLVAQTVPTTYDLSRLRNETAPLVRNSPKSPLEGFQICGSDKRWVWADAKIDGPTVVVANPQITAPLAVRYAWASNPTGNLFNSAGLPASPFRTDDFPATTLDQKF